MCGYHNQQFRTVSPPRGTGRSPTDKGSYFLPDPAEAVKHNNLLGDETAAGKVYLDELNRSGSNLSHETCTSEGPSCRVARRLSRGRCFRATGAVPVLLP
jgi:hypothetical protein